MQQWLLHSYHCDTRKKKSRKKGGLRRLVAQHSLFFYLYKCFFVPSSSFLFFFYSSRATRTRESSNLNREQKQTKRKHEKVEIVIYSRLLHPWKDRERVAAVSPYTNKSRGAKEKREKSFFVCLDVVVPKAQPWGTTKDTLKKLINPYRRWEKTKRRKKRKQSQTLRYLQRHSREIENRKQEL